MLFAVDVESLRALEAQLPRKEKEPLYAYLERVEAAGNAREIDRPPCANRVGTASRSPMLGAAACLCCCARPSRPRSTLTKSCGYRAERRAIPARIGRRALTPRSWARTSAGERVMR
jgi:hypothetical protein